MFVVSLQILMVLSVSIVHATDLVSQRTILLNDGNRMPMMSFGTVGKREIADKVVKPSVIEAIEAGYRQIDTAAIYENEEYIGEAITDVISRGIVTREELWITTKFNLSEYDILGIWKGMEDVKRLNLTRSIGVSNFNSTHINSILANSETIPAANEIEVNPTYANLELVAYCQSLNITVLSYAPFGFMVPRPFSLYPVETSFQEPILVELGQKYGKLPSQIVVRYLIYRGTVPIPRSNNATHIRTNIDVFDFQLTEEDIYAINELNRNAKVYIFEGKSLYAFLSYYGLHLS